MQEENKLQAENKSLVENEALVENETLVKNETLVENKTRSPRDQEEHEERGRSRVPATVGSKRTHSKLDQQPEWRREDRSRPRDQIQWKPSRDGRSRLEENRFARDRFQGDRSGRDRSGGHHSGGYQSGGHQSGREHFGRDRFQVDSLSRNRFQRDDFSYFGNDRFRIDNSIQDYPVQPYPFQSYPVPSYPVQSYPVRDHSVQNHPVPNHSSQDHLIQDHLIQNHLIQNHLIQDRPARVHFDGNHFYADIFGRNQFGRDQFGRDQFGRDLRASSESSGSKRRKLQEQPDQQEKLKKREKRVKSNKNTNLPQGWRGCPKQGEIIQGLLLPIKTPLDDRYAGRLDQEERFTPEMVLESHKLNGENVIGLWFDLTATSRYYDSKLVSGNGVRYVKLEIQGHAEPPTKRQTRTFVETCKEFVRENPGSLIVVHCAHGHNRTGFLICAFLVERLRFSVEDAVSMFAQCRPPGIYKSYYIRELFKRYGNAKDAPAAPKKPKWAD